MSPPPKSPAPAALPAPPAVPGFTRVVGALWMLSWKDRFTWRRAPLATATLFAVPLLAWLTIPRTALPVFLAWAAHLHLGLLIPLYCLVVCGGMIRDEVQEDTLGFLVTRPLTRARLYVGKYLCVLVWIQIIVGVNGGLLVLAGSLNAVPEAPALAGWILLAGALAALVYSALGSLFGLLSRRYIVLGLVYGFIVEVGIGHIPTNINSLSMMRHVQTLLAGNPAVRDSYGWSNDGAATGALIMVAASLIALIAGAVCFTRQEFLVNHDAPQ